MDGRVKKMDMKILAAAFAATLLVFAGVAFAMPGWDKWNGANDAAQGRLGRGAWQLNGTSEPMPVPPWQNGTWHAGNYSQFNSTQLEKFRSAVESGDFSAAKQLHDEYGFGGMLFGKLDETTFAKYSRIYQLQSELRNMTSALHQELGLKGGMGPRGRAFMDGFGMGFASGMRHGRMR